MQALASDTAAWFRRLRLSLFAGRARPVRPRQSSGRVVLGVVALAGIGAFVVFGAMLWALHDLPLDSPAQAEARSAVLLEASDGTPLGRLGPLKSAQAKREEFSDHLVRAVLSVEDRRFYSHFGIDPFGIVRAARRNMAAGKIVEGGSTITQQLVKMQLLGNDRTYTRKLREALTAIWLELHTGKDEILTRYLNTVYLGGGAHGMAAAARLYFDKHPADLSLAEAALLAGLIRAPSQFNPLRNLESAQARAEVVLDAMVANGAIDQATADDVKANPATLHLAPEVSQAGSWFADWVAQEAAEIAGSLPHGVRVRTTLMPRLQELAERVVADALAEQGGRAGVSQAALVALRPDGAVLAMVGGRDYDNSQFNRATEANRHPGSAFKLFVYMAALRNGYTLDDTIDAGPVNIKGWRPENFGGETYRRATLSEAFARSINTAAVHLALDVGLDEVIAAARDLGIDAELTPVPSLALGAAEVSLLDLTGAYASVLANKMRVEPWGIAAFGAEGEPRLRALGPHIGSQELGPYQQSLIDLLRATVEHGTGRAAALDGFAAGKTGTSQNHRDAWFVGFSETLVVGVWVGNDDGTPMERIVGGTLPASIWKRFVSEANGLVEGERAPLVAEERRPAPTVETLPAADAPATEDRSLAREAAVKPAQDKDQVHGESQDRAQCDYRACADRYRSFRVSDCTYQPYAGPRARCELGGSSTGEGVQASQASSAPARAGQCNVDVCAAEYRSFDAADCTYQPFDGGPRRLCER